jgi:inner membrane protein
VFFFAHLGITVGAGAAAGFLTDRLKRPESISGRPGFQKVSPENPAGRRRRDLLGGLFDLRFWALGSLLPDIIDKPVGHYLLAGIFQYNGRIFSHTLLLVVLLLVTALFLPHSKGRGCLIAVSAGVLMHLILDSMWLTPQTLFWPLLDWSFPASSEGEWLGSLIRGVTNNPAVFIPELIGIAILAALAVRLLHKNGLKQLIRSGRLI